MKRLLGGTAAVSLCLAGLTAVTAPMAAATPRVNTVGLMPGTVAQISASNNYTCAVTTDGDAYCWGNGRSGQVGNPDAVGDEARRIPLQVQDLGPGTDAGAVVEIDTGNQHVCAVTARGDAYCWGHNGTGQLGDGTTTRRHTPVQVQDLGPGTDAGPVAQISAGVFFSCATTTAGDAYCWGGNLNGGLGDGTNTESTTPVQVVEGEGLTPGTVAQISAGERHTCATSTDGDAYCWGHNEYGQLGDGSNADTTTPVQIGFGLLPLPGTITQIDADFRSTCAATIDGAYCWGQLSNLTVASLDSNIPLKVAPGPGLSPLVDVQISAGTAHRCATTSLGNAYCWGENVWGQLGDGTQHQRPVPTTPVLIPYPLPHPLPVPPLPFP